MSDSDFAAAPEFRLSSVAGGPVRLADLCSDGPALLVFATDECPTCALTLRRLAPVAELLSRLGITTGVVFEDPLEIAARAARRAGFPGAVLCELPPYEVSRSYELESVPTTVLVDHGKIVRRAVGWDVERLDELLEQACRAVGAPTVGVTDEPPRRKAGCAAKRPTTRRHRC
jgi:peroxiredoxin